MPKLEKRVNPKVSTTARASAPNDVRRRAEVRQSDLLQSSRDWQSLVTSAIGRFWRPSPRAVNHNFCKPAARAPSELAALRFATLSRTLAFQCGARNGAERVPPAERETRSLAASLSFAKRFFWRRPASPCVRGSQI